MNDEGDYLPENQTDNFSVREIRFIIGRDTSEVYCFVDTDLKCPAGVHGWHVKQFPSNKPFKEIYDEMCRNDSPLLWPNVEPIPRLLTMTDLERIKI